MCSHYVRQCSVSLPVDNIEIKRQICKAVTDLRKKSSGHGQSVHEIIGKRSVAAAHEIFIKKINIEIHIMSDNRKISDKF